MKAFALLLCALAVAQANVEQRIAVGGSTAVAGDSPSVVHIRTTLFDTGYLRTCAGSLINERWLLTTGSCVDNARFTWLRYGALTVQNPNLVTELSPGASNRFVHPQYNAATGANNIALLFTNRFIQRNGYIDYAAISFSAPRSTGRFCSFGAINRVSGALMQLRPGEDLRCATVAVEQQADLLVATSNDGFATQFDDGAPLVDQGQQVGILVSWPAAATGNIVGVFLRPFLYLDWIRATTGLAFPDGSEVSVID